MSSAEKIELQQRLNDISLQALLLAKLISDGVDRKDQLDQMVRVLDLISEVSRQFNQGEAAHG